MPKVTKKNSSKITTRSARSNMSQDAMNELIQKKAYELYEKRGCNHGSDWNDWLEAERIIRSGKY